MVTIGDTASAEPYSSGDALALLGNLHDRLNTHFNALSEQRQKLEPAGLVFALEHGLEPAEFELLQSAVRAAVAAGFDAQFRAWWLPFVVFAADVGYDYVGVDYWPPFAERTPGWENQPGWNRDGNRRQFRSWFEQFAADYGGARPTGAWAKHFKNISWPITHAVMPAYLQHQLAQLLYDFRPYLSTDLLNNPDALGAKLATRTGGFSERFRIFCSQHALLGRVAVALLAGEEESPYLVRSVLHRIVEGLSSEQRARVWLQRARQSANRVRASGFRPVASSGSRNGGSRAAAALSDPRLSLKRLEDGWHLFAELPDLTPLVARLPHVYEELRTLQGRIAGVQRPVAPGRLLHPGEQQLGALPQPGQPFVQLERGSNAVNAIIADQCRLTPGPWWVFRRRTRAHAVEVKGKVVRPGHTYVLLGRPEVTPPAVPWIQALDARVTGAQAVELTVPEQVSDDEIGALTAAAISLLSGVAIRPVGLVPLAWDGEGAVEYLAGEPVMLALRSERRPEKCVMTVDGGAPELIDWPPEAHELFFAVDDLPVGVHEIAVMLLTSREDAPVVSGFLAITVREARAEPGTAAAGVGIRLLPSPARPLLTDLWDGHATLTVEGPPETQAQLTVTLKSDVGEDLAQLRRTIDLPMSEDGWRRFARRDLRGPELGSRYDAAESCEVTVALGGIGFTTLQCERGFTPLRWLLNKRHEGGYEARLIDRTDGASTIVDLYETAAPLVPVRQSVSGLIPSPTHGGLLRAVSGELSAVIVLPPDPNQLWQQGGTVRPFVQVGGRSIIELMRLICGHAAWLSAELPADPFAEGQRQQALNAIASELAGLIGGHRWARQERVQRGLNLMDHVDAMCALVGDAPAHRALAHQISLHLHEWAGRPAVPVQELAELVTPTVVSGRLGDPVEVARFLVRLCGVPGDLMEWDDDRRRPLLEGVLGSPVLVRAGRFAVLGREAFVEDRAGGNL